MTRVQRYANTLRAIPGFDGCSRRELDALAALVDEIDVPSGTVIGHSGHEVVMTLEPTRLLVVGRRAWPALAEVIRRTPSGASGGSGLLE